MNSSILFELLDASLKRSPLKPHYDFLPLDILEKVITRENVKTVLRTTWLKRDQSERIVRCAKKVFAILMLIGEQEKIRGLMSDDINDEDLPLSKPPGTGLGNVLISHDGKKTFKSFTTWENHAHIKQFLIQQWLVQSPILDTSGRHLILADRCSLPFVKADPVVHAPRTAVYQGEVHPAHQTDFENANGDLRVAIKQFIMTDIEFSKERKNLDAISHLNHPHLIRHHLTCETGGDYFVIFPWAAGGSLENLWKSDQRNRNAELATWVIQQMLGCAMALNVLHDMNFRHGDLKPDNILHFSHPTESLVIADVGVARIHKEITHMRKEGTTTKATTPSYQAPEACESSNNPRSRKYDIWSLGCVLLEFTVWIFYDYKAIELFRTARSASQDQSYFYKRINGKMYVHPKVTEMIQILKDDERCKGTGFEALVQLIQDKLLQVDVNNRFSAEEIAGELRSVLKKSESDSTYLSRLGDIPVFGVRPFESLLRRHTSEASDSEIVEK